ncbi:MAG: CPBP family intramembrane metalloprotease [Streptococcus sp.]|nr:MAG: CPBP family intramembrane metalloprotease [Streptococcus sp.]
MKFSWYRFIFLTALLFLINLFFIKGEEFWYQMVIASCEEFLFRYCLYRILRNNFSKPQTLLICSLLFGILLHLNYDIIDNLLIRSPIGFILGLVTMRFGLHYSIAAHWFINLLAALFQ